jgi:hypothetical protein
VFCAFREAVCIAVDVALADTAKIFSAAAKFSALSELKYAGKIVSIGDMVFAQGTSAGDCPNAACPGHVFTQIE